jgi:LPS sulfotransferase NodH
VSRQKFVILAAPRTGSNLLCALLNSHPEILCHHEVFNPRGIFYALDLRNGALDLGTPAERDADPFGFLARLWQIPGDAGCVGFKMTRGQSEEILNKVLGDPTIKKIIVRRRNRVKTLVSELVAAATDQWELYSAADRIACPTVSLNLDHLLQHVAENDSFYDAIYRTLESENQPHLTLEYESLCSRPEQLRALHFLGVAAVDHRLTAISVKQTPTDLRKVVCNFSDIERALIGTDYHHELHDLGQ